MRFLVVNPLADNKTWCLKRMFRFINSSFPADGDLGLNVWVSGPDKVGLEGANPMMLVVGCRRIRLCSSRSLRVRSLVARSLLLVKGSGSTCRARA